MLDEKKNMVESPIYNVSRIVPGIEKLSKGVVSDPIADLLVCLRHGQVRGLSKIYTPASSVKRGILTVLREEGFIRGFSELPYECRFSSEAGALAFISSQAQVEETKRSVGNKVASFGGSDDCVTSAKGQEAPFCLPFSLFPLVRWRRTPIVSLRRPRRSRPSHFSNKPAGGNRATQQGRYLDKAAQPSKRGFFLKEVAKPPNGGSARNNRSYMKDGSGFAAGDQGGKDRAFAGGVSRPRQQSNLSRQQSHPKGAFAPKGAVTAATLPMGSLPRPATFGSLSRPPRAAVRPPLGTSPQGGKATYTSMSVPSSSGKRSTKPRYLAACYQHFSDRQQVSFPKPALKGPNNWNNKGLRGNKAVAGQPKGGGNAATKNGVAAKTDGGRLSLAGWKAKRLPVMEAQRAEDAKKPAWVRFRRATPYKDLAYQPVAFGPFDFKRMRKQVEAERPMYPTSSSASSSSGSMYFEVELFVGVVGIRSTKRISRPGNRVYATAAEVKDFLTSSLRSLGVHSRVIAESGLGCVVLSTNRGILSYRRAQALGLGGEVLCAVA